MKQRWDRWTAGGLWRDLLQGRDLTPLEVRASNASIRAYIAPEDALQMSDSELSAIRGVGWLGLEALRGLLELQQARHDAANAEYRAAIEYLVGS